MSSVSRDHRTDAIAFAVIVVAALAVFGPPLARHEVFTFRDHTDYFAPMRLYTAMHLRAGRLPLWNPYNGSGEQWLANPQTAVFYPPAWVFLVSSFTVAFVLYLLIHALILGAGTYRLLRLRVGPRGAVFGSVALMLSGPVLSLMDVQNNFTTFAWVPWILWCGIRDGGRDGQPRLAALLLAFAFLGGEPFYAAVAALLYCVAVRNPKKIIVAGLGAAAIAAVQLFPFVDLMIGSDRFGGFARSDILRNSMRGRDWLRVVVPPEFLTPAPRQAQHFIFVVYAGLLVCVLAAIGVAIMARQARGAAAGWLALLVVSLAVAAGPSFLAGLPLTVFRYPSRVLPFAMIAIVTFAAAAWDRARGRSVIVDAAVLILISADFLYAARPLLATAPAARPLLVYPAEIGRGSKYAQVYGDNPLRAGSRAAWMSGYLNLHQLRFTASTPAPLSPRSYTKLFAAALTNFDLLGEIGVAWLLVPGALPASFAQAAHIENVFTYRLPRAFPMAYVRTRDGKILPPRSLALDASRGRVSVVTSAGGLLVLTQNDARGWRVTVDGRPAQKKLERGTFRAVEVPPGKHEISWVFRPFSLQLGAGVTIAALIWLAFGLKPRRAV